MPTPVTPTLICQLALAEINTKTIASLSDQNERVRKCLLWYDTCRRDALRGCDWSFARTVSPLALIGSWDQAGVNFPFWAQSSQANQNTITGNIAANGGMVAFVASGTIATITIAGVWSGTLSVEVSTDGGQTWPSVLTLTSNQTNLAVGTNQNSCLVRVVAIAWTSGTATVTLTGSQTSPINNSPTAYNAVPQWNFVYRFPGGAPNNNLVQGSLAGTGLCVMVRKVFNPQHPIVPNPYHDRTIRESYHRPSKFEILRTPGTNEIAIATNLQCAWAKWTQDISDTSQFDETFIQAFALYLANKVVMPLTGDKELLQIIEGRLKEKMGEARRLNLTEAPEYSPKNNDYEDAREFC